MTLDFFYGFLVVLAFLSLVGYAFTKGPWADFMLKVNIIKQRGTNIWRMTPNWTKYSNAKPWELFLRNVFTRLTFVKFKHRPGKAHSDLAGIVLLERSWLRRRIDLHEIVFLSYKEGHIKKSLGNMIHSLTMKHPTYKIVIYCPSEKWAEDILDVLEIAENERYNILKERPYNSRDNSVKRYEICLR